MTKKITHGLQTGYNWGEKRLKNRFPMQQITLKDNFMRKKYYICTTEDKYK